MSSGNINSQDSVGATKLFEAVSKGDLKKVKQLLTEHADPNIPENNGTTPLMEAASDGNLEMIKLLLANGAKANLKDNFGDDALRYAHNQDFPAISEFLSNLG